MVAGCASTNTYVEPKIDGVSTIHNLSRSKGAFTANWENYIVQVIDGLPVSYTKEYWLGHPAKAYRAIAPGKHRLLIAVTFNRTFGGSGPFESYVELDVDIFPNTAYQLAGEIKGTQVRVWLSDKATGDAVSDVVFSTYRSQPKSNFVPLYVPVPK